MKLPSSLIQQAVDAISTFPGIGKKTALRLVVYLLKNKQQAYNISNSIKRLIESTKYCNNCYNISKDDICMICSNPKRNKQMICVVQDIRDIMAIENTMQYNGHYHVLGGLISPIDGIGPSELNIDHLVSKMSQHEIKEVIFALCASMEGETTSYYLYKKLSAFNIQITTISKGISVGNELEYTDQITLGRALTNRYSFIQTLKE